MNRQTNDSRMGLRALYCAAYCLYTPRNATMYKPYYASTFSAIAALFINYYTLLVYIRQALFCHISVIVKNRKPALYGWLLYLYNYFFICSYRLIPNLTGSKPIFSFSFIINSILISSFCMNVQMPSPMTVKVSSIYFF